MEDTPDARPASRMRGTFYWKSAVVIALLIVLSFPQTYFLPIARGDGFRLLRHLHGLAFFAFTALFVWQAWLVRTRRVARHREWGSYGGVLVGMMLVLGVWLAIVAVEDRAAKSVAQPFEFAIYNLVDITLFCGLVAWSIREAYHRVDWHRHLLFAAFLGLLGPAWSRWLLQLPVAYPLLDMSPSVFADLGLVVLALHDRRTIGRVHPATWAAAALMVPIHIVEPWIARSDWWNALAPRLFGFG